MDCSVIHTYINIKIEREVIWLNVRTTYVDCSVTYIVMNITIQVVSYLLEFLFYQ